MPEQLKPSETSAKNATPPPLIGAPLWRRFAALVYDIFILVAISLLYVGVLTFIHTQLYGAPSEKDYQPMFDNTLVFLGWHLTLTLFYVIFWRRFGQTIGMKTWHLRLIPATPNNTADTQDKIDEEIKVPWIACIQRGIIGTFAFVFLGVGYWYRWFNKSGDCLHDTLSHTRVIVVKPSKVKPTKVKPSKAKPPK